MKKTLKPIEDFFKKRGWKPFPFQRETWEAMLKGESGLLYVPTGSGKTYAAVMPIFAKLLQAPKKKGLKALYITPLRALARDLELALQEPIEQEKWPIKIESRTGDTKSSLKKKQLTNPADLLLTTPESLEILISQKNAVDLLKSIETVIIDEWHELLASKRGSLLELSLAFLRSLNPDLKIWVLSASIGNPEEAARVAVGRENPVRIIQGGNERKLDVTCLLPKSLDRFPWGGHLGFALKESLAQELDAETSTLIFTNTRNQAERWFQTLTELRPDMKDLIALHHSSLDREEREAVEAGVKNGDIKWVVCTSSLDLGVDFQPVERVVQIGSPKMIARMLQRAGRSAHRPGGKSRLLFVPTNSWEILELEALKKALVNERIESRKPLMKPIDVLLQHMTTIACGPGLNINEFWESLQSTYSFSMVTRQELNWCLKFLTQGGEILGGYEQFHKLVYDPEQARYFLAHSKLESLHRMSIGTIVSSEQVKIVFTNQKSIGSLDESFIAKLKKGDIFQFGGRKLQFVMLSNMMAYVKLSQSPTNFIPSWGGHRLPISETLSEAFRQVLHEPHGKLDTLLAPLLKTQARLSNLPDEKDLLMETWSSKEGEHLYVYPFEGRSVHEGLAQLWSLRFAQREPSTFSFSINDYGFEILGPEGYDFKKYFDDDFFNTDHLQTEFKESLHLGQMTQRKFREIAQVAGLIFVGYPGSQKTGKQKQVSSSLLYDVFRKYEPGNLLIEQSFQEVFQTSLQLDRMTRCLNRLSTLNQKWQVLASPSPLAFPLLIERVASHLSNETLEKKIERLKKSWEKADKAEGAVNGLELTR